MDLEDQNTGPYGVAVSSSGEVWFTQHKANKISCIQSDGRVVEYPIPTPDAKVLCLTVSSDDDVWFTENRANKIGRITKEGIIVEYPLPNSISGPYGITEGPNKKIWFTEIKWKSNREYFKRWQHM
ncbi:putative hydrolase [Sporolactobacillus inulinus]|uniref:Putative hydrolase n=1 Tax=Sporolactobacillus inulinus TaxID=2078 RepID=A0A4Y1ZH05_9BACL|nr:putative hydrolase [Sporolactobacillus inulinus]